MYTKRARGGPIPFFTKIPQNLDLWMGKNGKKVYENKGK